MSSQNDGGSAFPVPPTISTKDGLSFASEGMTLRDYFAAKVCQSIYVGANGLSKANKEQIEEMFAAAAAASYMAADAMLKERAK